MSLCALAIAACVSLWLSNLAVPARLAAGAAAVSYVAWLLWREASRQPAELAWMGGDGAWRIECEGRAQSLRHVGASVRGGLAVLTLADENGGGRRRYVWWPDTLDAGGRRALRLAAIAAHGAAITRVDA